MTAPDATEATDILQFHVLTAFPPHNVNRDEDGRPKTCTLGGTPRGRISSQAKKRALRFAPHFPGHQRATRTREAGIQTFNLLKSEIGELDAIRASIAVNIGLGAGNGAAKIKNLKPDVESAKKLIKRADQVVSGKSNDVDDDDQADLHAGIGLEKKRERILLRSLRSEQGLVVSSVELSNLNQRVSEILEKHRSNAPDFTKSYDAWLGSVEKGLLISDDQDLDTALFGRMVAAKPDFNVEAACAVSHAFTTHAYSVEGDYFSAGEELNALNETGAAITAYAFFGGGVYYQHAVLNVSDLRQTLSQGRDEGAAQDLAAKACGAFLEGLVFAQPKGKRNAYASDVAASYVLVTRGSDPAVNLGLAFLNPVRPKDGKDMMQVSIDTLNHFHAALRQAYGLTNTVCIFNAYPSARGNAPEAPETWSFEDLRRFVAGDVS